MSYKIKKILFPFLFYITCHPCCAGVQYITSVTPQPYGVQVKLHQYSNYPTFTPYSSSHGGINTDFYIPLSDSDHQSDVSRRVSSKKNDEEQGNDGKQQNEESKEESNHIHDQYPNSTEIPLEMIQKLNEYSNIEDVLENLVENYEKEPPSIASRFGETDYDDEERSAAIKPKPATCKPQLKTVQLIESHDPNVVYLPSCTRIEQCDGCCRHPLLSCQPTETEVVNFVVHKCQYTGGDRLKYVSKEIVVKEKHLKCHCGCKVQPKDCKGFRKFNPATCSCSCPNKDERQKCLKESDKKLWNPKICACQCRDEVPCSTNQQFDHHKCQCVLNLERRNVHGGERTYNDNVDRALPLYNSHTSLVPYE
ncbi:uncharacterized protein LOC108740647 isoform X1 [Agrilus planipennis]|uniref:Uncharacterized protein LOC108740647 isoform X1 n=1 Tax=Agrilus planipennis TaxID=224129 RepID=A0A1W4XDN0_AGRPL|nr:uncharacterized protein LOC108740647 isoform X2 [Agrilus planipennis]XP_018330538.1 uncharacterized protein LOC108740647 isoform X1 [Agrilus planipennis]